MGAVRDRVSALLACSKQAARRPSVVYGGDSAASHSNIHGAEPSRFDRGGGESAAKNSGVSLAVPGVVGPNLGLADRSLVSWGPHAGKDLFLAQSNHRLLSIVCHLCPLNRTGSQREGEKRSDQSNMETHGTHPLWPNVTDGSLPPFSLRTSAARYAPTFFGAGAYSMRSRQRQQTDQPAPLSGDALSGDE
jgi:hypothetical protein